MIGLWYVAHLERAPTSVDVPSCVACGEKASEHVAVYALPFVEAPYCSDCADRARRKEWNVPFMMMAAAFVLPSLVVIQPFGSVSGSLLFAFVLSFVVPSIHVLITTFVARGGVAVRAHQLMPVILVDCARRDVADALAKTCGGYVHPRRSIRLTPAISFVPLTVFVFAFGYMAARYLFLATIAIDDGGQQPITVTIDGRASTVAAGANTTTDVRVGRHLVAWTGGGSRMERAVDLDRKHDALVNPGATVCYRKSVAYAGFLSPRDREEVATAGLLPLEELQVLHAVKHWFAPVPAQKNDEVLEPNVEIGIMRDERCTALLTCAAFVECFRAAKDPPARDACVDHAPTSCR